MPRPLCFVLMPFGKKPDSAGKEIDFDAVYWELIAPAVEAAGIEPVRADQEETGGIVHKAMFERLALCEYAVADLTTASANVFYELGIRHAARPRSTVSIFADSGSRLPFDVAPVRAIPYRLSPEGKPADVDACRAALTARLNAAKEPSTDSPIHQLLDKFPDIPHTKVDVFRERIQYSAERKKELEDARIKRSKDAVAAVEAKLDRLDTVEAGVLVDLLISYREVKAFDKMVALVEKMPREVAASVLVQEQYGLALNRIGQSDKAEQVLLDVIKGHGPSSETYGILGRVYKDRWQAAVKAQDVLLAPSALKKAIDAYLKGFEADWRDFFPGINVLTLMEMQDPPDPRRIQLNPVVTYAAERSLGGKPNYWVHATLLELAVLANDQERAMTMLGNALTCKPSAMEADTTANNLAIIRQTRTRRGESQPWLQQIEERLRAEAKK